MVNLRGECNLGRLEGIIGGEMDVQEKHALVIGCVLWAHNGGLPVHLIRLVGGASRAVCGRVSTEIYELLLDSFKCHNNTYNK